MGARFHSLARQRPRALNWPRENICASATMSADEASHWDLFEDMFPMDRVNHSEMYSDHGKHTNMVERYVSRPQLNLGPHGCWPAPSR